MQQFFSPCTFTPLTRQRLRGRSRCKRSTSTVLNYFAYGMVAATAFKGSFQVQKASINGTLQYGVRKGASSFDFVDFCSSPFRQGYRKGPPRSCPCRQVHGHAVLNYFAYGIVVFVVRDISAYRVCLAQSRPLTGSRVKKVSTTCRLRVDQVYSGTLSGTLILVPFSCHKTGTSSTSMERLQTGSLWKGFRQEAFPIKEYRTQNSTLRDSTRNWEDSGCSMWQSDFLPTIIQV